MTSECGARPRSAFGAAYCRSRKLLTGRENDTIDLACARCTKGRIVVSYRRRGKPRSGAAGGKPQAGRREPAGPGNGSRLLTETPSGGKRRKRQPDGFGRTERRERQRASVRSRRSGNGAVARSLIERSEVRREPQGGSGFLGVSRVRAGSAGRTSYFVCRTSITVCVSNPYVPTSPPLRRLRGSLSRCVPRRTNGSTGYRSTGVPEYQVRAT